MVMEPRDQKLNKIKNRQMVRGKGEHVPGWWLHSHTAMLFCLLSIWLSWPGIKGRRQSTLYMGRESKLIRC